MISKVTLEKEFFFSKSGHLHIEVYIDANWVGSLMDKRSMTKYSTLGKQHRWLWQDPMLKLNFKLCHKKYVKFYGLKDYYLGGFKLEPKTLTKIYCDNEVVINIAHNPIQHDHTKHVKMDRHFMKVKN